MNDPDNAQNHRVAAGGKEFSFSVGGNSGGFCCYFAFGGIMVGRRVEIMFTDDEPTGRVRVIVCGQTCGPSLPASAAEFKANSERLQQVFQSVFDRGIEIGTANTQQSVKMALGLPK